MPTAPCQGTKKGDVLCWALALALALALVQAPLPLLPLLLVWIILAGPWVAEAWEEEQEEAADSPKGKRHVAVAWPSATTEQKIKGMEWAWAWAWAWQRYTTLTPRASALCQQSTQIQLISVAPAP